MDNNETDIFAEYERMGELMTRNANAPTLKIDNVSDVEGFLKANGYKVGKNPEYSNNGTTVTYNTGFWHGNKDVTADLNRGTITVNDGDNVVVYTMDPKTTGSNIPLTTYEYSADYGVMTSVSNGVDPEHFTEMVVAMSSSENVGGISSSTSDGDDTADTSAPLDSSSEGEGRDSSVEDGPWYGEYNGNVIFYDKNQTAGAKTVLNVLSESFEEQSNQIEANDGYFDSVPSRYESLIPDPRYADIKGEISQAFEDAHTELIATIDSISESILELSRGELSDNGKLILDSLLGLAKPDKGAPANDTPYDGGDGGPDSGGGIPDGGIGDIPVDNLNDNGDVAGENPDVGGNGDVDNLEDDVKNLGTSEDYVIPVLEDFNHVNELTDGDDKVIDSDDKLDSFKGDYSTSSNSLFSIPTPTNKIEGVKKSSGVGFAAATVAAVASGVGGKFYYDYKHSDDEEEKDDENSDDDVAEEVNDHLTDNTNPDIPINSVDLKNKILEDAEEEKRND